jgi:hypothetical protein
MSKLAHYFIIHGNREDGNYSIFEIIDDKKESVNKIFGNKRQGLKESRQWIGMYLRKHGFSNNQKMIHKCEKPDRDESKNPYHEWTVEQYVNGVGE